MAVAVRADIDGQTDGTERRAEFFSRLAVVGKAFASAKRLELVDLLAQGERAVYSLARQAGMGITTTSSHLQILKMAHVVSTRRAGTRVYYRLSGDDVATLYASLGRVARAHSADVERALEAYLGTGSLDDVELIRRDDLMRRIEDGEVQVVDVRPAEEFDAGHIPGARSLPFGELTELTERLESLDPNLDLVAYCRGAHCVMAHDAVRLLEAEGRHAARLEDGMLEWRLSGLPVEVDV